MWDSGIDTVRPSLDPWEWFDRPVLYEMLATHPTFGYMGYQEKDQLYHLKHLWYLPVNWCFV